MLDIRRIRENPEEVIKLMSRRNKDYAAEIGCVADLDTILREITTETETLKAEQNEASKRIPSIKKSGGDVSGIMSRMREISARTANLDARLREIKRQIEELLLSIPNLPREDTPQGKDENSNVEIRRNGQPPSFAFTPLPHWELGEALGILDPAAAAKTTGSRFHFLKGAGARLERAIVNFFLDTHVSRGYTEIFPPFMVNRAAMIGTGQLPKFEEDAFRLRDADFFLIPTAEVPVTNMHRDEILQEELLPISYCAYSACFRAEAGSAGRDTRGLIRQHQFNKVELVKFSKPEQSYEDLETLTSDACEVLIRLGLPFRVVRLCGGDLGFCSAQTYDIEVWMPSYGRFVEISSCSNMEDYQARRAGIRCRPEGGRPRPAHTLNGSGVAVGRTAAAILENFQREDGSVAIPPALLGYMGGVRELKPEN